MPVSTVQIKQCLLKCLVNRVTTLLPVKGLVLDVLQVLPVPPLLDIVQQFVQQAHIQLVVRQFVRLALQDQNVLIQISFQWNVQVATTQRLTPKIASFAQLALTVRIHLNFLNNVVWELIPMQEALIAKLAREESCAVLVLQHHLTEQFAQLDPIVLQELHSQWHALREPMVWELVKQKYRQHAPRVYLEEFARLEQLIHQR